MCASVCICWVCLGVSVDGSGEIGLSHIDYYFIKKNAHSIYLYTVIYSKGSYKKNLSKKT